MPHKPDASHQMDMVTLFRSSSHDAEMEAMQIHGVMEANGISCIVVGTSALPVLEFEVQVPRENLEEARRILADAQAAGPEGAAEAEAAGEEGA